MRLALCFANYGPYHCARLRACKALDLNMIGVQLSPDPGEYSWSGDPAVDVQTVAGREKFGWLEAVRRHFDQLNPDVCAVAGYSHPGMLAILLWALGRKKPMILMSDSRFEDEPRSAWKEVIKSVAVRFCSTGLVAGEPQARYLQSLGMTRSSVFLGYDVVDNEHFRRPNALHQNEKCFLTSARFIKKKNLLTLLKAYRCYRDRVQNEPWRLVVLGDGLLRGQIERLVSELKLNDCVELRGFIQYPGLPAHYHSASAFVLASRYGEQWGLVVNEAMAAGLPVLVSKGCGCVEDLVQEGVNGWVLDPYSETQMAEAMIKMSAQSDEQLRKMGAASEHGLCRGHRGKSGRQDRPCSRRGRSRWTTISSRITA